MRSVAAWSVATASVLLAGCAAPLRSANPDSFDTISYRGETIRLGRAYDDFDVYKEDPANIPAAEAGRVARLVREARIAASFTSRAEAREAILALEFPGYGFTFDRASEPVALFAVEVPLAGEDRWFAVAEDSGAWRVIDDFLWSTSRGYIVVARLSGLRLSYYDRSGILIRERQLPGPN